MRYLAFIILIICVVGVSSVFAAQNPVQPATSTFIASKNSTINQANPVIDFLVNLPANTVKYQMPIEMVIAAIPGYIGVIPALIGQVARVTLLFQAGILLLPIWLIFKIF